MESQLHAGKVFWYVAPTYKQAKEIVWRDPDMLQKYIPEAIVDRKNDTELTYYFKNGSVLGVKGADNPDSLRGPNPLGTVLDEFPTMKRAVWEEIVSPVVFANPEAWCWFIGTPKPQGAHAHKLHTDAANKPNWQSVTITAEDSGILTADMLTEARGSMTQAGFEQEFMCRWFDEGGVVFRGVERCIEGSWDPEAQLPDPRCSYQFGVDLAKYEDWTVAIGINQQRHKVEFFDRYNIIDYNLQKARLEAALRRYRNAVANVESNGPGTPVIEDLRSRGLNVVDVQMTAPMKKNLIENLVLWIEQVKIKFPPIPELIEELRIFGYEVSKAGHVRYSAPEGYHDDCVMALALAIWNLGNRLTPSPVLKEQAERRKVVRHKFT